MILKPVYVKKFKPKIRLRQTNKNCFYRIKASRQLSCGVGVTTTYQLNRFSLPTHGLERLEPSIKRFPVPFHTLT